MSPEIPENGTRIAIVTGLKLHAPNGWVPGDSVLATSDTTLHFPCCRGPPDTPGPVVPGPRGRSARRDHTHPRELHRFRSVRRSFSWLRLSPLMKQMRLLPRSLGSREARCDRREARVREDRRRASADWATVWRDPGLRDVPSRSVRTRPPGRPRFAATCP